MGDETFVRRRRRRPRAPGAPIGLADGVPIPAFMVAVDDDLNFLEVHVPPLTFPNLLEARVAPPTSPDLVEASVAPPTSPDLLEAPVALPTPPGQFVGDFTVDKQEDDDLCWAAVTVSAAKYRQDINWTQQELVQDAHQANAEQCPCTDHPGDNGLNLWCVDCAFAMIRLPYVRYTEAPWFSSLGTVMGLKKPVCILRTGVPQNHYVVAVGTYVNALGQQMVRISDPDPSQPGQQDVEYRSLVTGPEAVLEWYQF